MSMERKMRCKVPIIVILSVAIVCEILSNISTKNGEPYYYLDWDHLLIYVMDLIPSVFLLLGITAFEGNRTHIAAFAAGSYLLIKTESAGYFRRYSMPFERFIVLTCHAIAIILLVIYISGFFGKNKEKIPKVVGLALGGVTFLYILIWELSEGSAFFKMYWQYMETLGSSPTVTDKTKEITGWTATNLLFVAFYLFALFKGDSSVENVSVGEGSVRMECNEICDDFHERKLQILSDKFELGIISEDEYKAQRAEIINNI